MWSLKVKNPGRADQVFNVGKRRGHMPTIVNVYETKTHFSKLLERAHAGEEIILAKAGKPYARLGPLESAQPRKPGIAEGRLDEAFSSLCRKVSYPHGISDRIFFGLFARYSCPALVAV